ncbi:MAG: histidyl-tRNA synthetase [Candidatus Tokpelaia sp. JSC085]|nr:MAG: histidyl-tRNA synthetase [Candidatus Tokpelaia sp. JSC085]
MLSKAGKKRARLPCGFFDKKADDLRVASKIITAIREVYELYGFEPVETPLIEYTDMLGKFLPDSGCPNAGVFSFRDDDEQWLSLRYDLTAPLARYVAENFERLPKPYRSYRVGWVFRNEKPGPGRFRQFLQFDADTVNTDNVISDSEICMMAADTLESLGLRQSDYTIRVNNRKVWDGVMEMVGLNGERQHDKRLTTLRAIDKLDKFGIEGVASLLGKGRLDESGAFTKGSELDAVTIRRIINFVAAGASTGAATLENLRKAIGDSSKGHEGLAELEEMYALFLATGYENRVKIDPSVIRGLEYYTGPVFEVELLLDIVNEDGRRVVFGSVGGGGRYDGLVSRFRSKPVPATGFSMGVSRLITALTNLGKLNKQKNAGPVIILLMDRDLEALTRYQHMVSDLRKQGIRAEIYVGNAGLKAQMKYADRRGAPCVVIQGSAERSAGTVEIKNMIEGIRLSQKIKDNAIWRKQSPAQITVNENQMVQEIKRILAIK